MLIAGRRHWRACGENPILKRARPGGAKADFLGRVRAALGLAPARVENSKRFPARRRTALHRRQVSRDGVRMPARPLPAIEILERQTKRFGPFLQIVAEKGRPQQIIGLVRVAAVPRLAQRFVPPLGVEIAASQPHQRQ